MDGINKRYIHDHVSTYKNREKLGISNRFVRAHRANEDRKALRLDEITKRRGLVLSLVNECNSFLEENADQKKTVKTKQAIRSKVKAKPSNKENAPQPQVTDDRRAMLLKWKEQRELKRKAGAVKKQQKGVFAVRHVQHEKKNFLAPFPAKATRISPKKPKSASVTPAKPVTRSSARLASKKTAIKSAEKGRPGSNRKEMPSVKKPVMVNKVEDVSKRVTRQSVKAKPSANTRKGSNNTIKTVIPKENEKTKVEEKNEEENNHPVVPEKMATPSEKKQQRKSFAPPNFQFTAPSGLYTFEHYSKQFKFQPLSPASTENFFKGLAPAVSTPENQHQENENPVPMTEAGDSNSSQAANEKDMGSRRENNDEQESKEIECEDNTLSSKYFRDLVLSETEKLNLLCEKWEKELESENELPEEAKGSIRTAIGQAQLLISQRFKQFSGLIDLSEDEAAEKKATMSDLQGFWDMIYFQVEDVHVKMDGLEKQKEKNWIIETKLVKTGAKKTKKNTTAKGVGKKSAKPAPKSKIQEMKAAMRAKMAEKKRQLQTKDRECTAFITVLTPVKKNKKPGLAENVVVLTPVRRSLRNTPISFSGTRHVTPKVISTPKRFGKKSPGLRLTPEAVSENPHDTGSDELPEEKMENGQENTDEKEKKAGSLSSDLGAQSSDDLSAKDNSSSENIDEDMDMMKDQKEISPGTKRRSCLRSSTKKKRKSSRVFFKSPRPSANCTAGGTPGSIVFTPKVQGGVWSTAMTLTPVTVSFDSPAIDRSTCSINAGHTPAPASDRRRSLRKRASNGTPARRSSQNNCATTSMEGETFSSDSAPGMSSSSGETHGETPSYVESQTPGRSGSKRKSLRRSCRKSTTKEKGDSFLPSKYFFPWSSSEEDGDNTAPAETPFLAGRDLHSDSQSLVTFTPVKDSSNRIDQSSLTPSTMFQALSLDSGRRDSVFFAPSGSLIDNSQPAKENLICFSPVLSEATK